MNSTLVTYLSEGENLVARAVGNSGDFWIGLKKTDGEWQWDDGYPLIYQNWLNDNVTNLKRKKLDCVQDKFYKIWVDRPCSEKASFICQYEAQFTCPEGWREYNGDCYIFERTAIALPEAEKYCALNGAEVTDVVSKEERLFLKEVSEQNPHWVQFRTQGGNQKNAKRLDNRRSENDSLTENNREIKHVIATSEGWKIPHKYTLTAAVICKYKSGHLPSGETQL
ncbi:unnamed protein product [Enterobius vermicularis]|uniref:C-type lectin domain-containing protein n=1 Tax=Enterobius vermicularis TaxID=51028 RepID=A0A0N4V9K5_ENTVE|nr:unnamed protein product [Enterobius vermicularis]